jgi:hypothetical protein
MQFEKHVKVRQEKFGSVVFETLREKIFVTNDTGADILQLLEEGKEPKDVIAELSKDYNLEPEIIKGDVDEFISMLKDNGIIKKE